MEAEQPLPPKQFDLAAYGRARDEVIARLEEIKVVAHALGREELVKDAGATQQDLQVESFRIVVVGEFSRGKSTFINALLGARVLPSSPKPTTALLNLIRHARNETYQIEFKKGTPPRELTREEFARLIAPDEPIPGDASSKQAYEQQVEYLATVDHAKVGYPTAFCQEGVEIVDTPGTNDLDATREAITYDFIPRSDAAIFLLAANHILAQSEMDFLQERILAKDIQRIFFVVNFKDKLPGPEAEAKVMAYAREHLSKVVPNPRLFLISAKNALAYRRSLRGEQVPGTVPASLEETGIGELEGALAQFLAVERGQVKLAKPAARGIRLASELSTVIVTRRKALGADAAALAQRAIAMQPEVTRAQYEREQAMSGLRTALEGGRLELRNQLRRGLEEVTRVAVGAVDSYTGELESKVISRAIEAEVAKVQTQLHERMQALQQRLLEEEVGRAVRRLDDAWGQLTEAIGQDLGALSVEGVSLSAGVSKDELAFQTGLGVAAIGLAASALHLALPFTLPLMLVGGSMIYDYLKGVQRQKVLGQVRAQIDKRYSDVIPGMLKSFDEHWTGLSDRILQELGREMGRRIDSIQATIQEILGQRDRAVTADRNEEERLAALQARLQAVIFALTRHAR
jgi:GTPase SAR1 family protein